MDSAATLKTKRDYLRKQHAALFFADEPPPVSGSANFTVTCAPADESGAMNVEVVTREQQCGVTDFDIIAALYSFGARGDIDHAAVSSIVDGRVYNRGVKVRVTRRDSVDPNAGRNKTDGPADEHGATNAADGLIEHYRNGIDTAPGIFPVTAGSVIIEASPEGPGVLPNPGKGVIKSTDGAKLIAIQDGYLDFDNGACRVLQKTEMSASAVGMPRRIFSRDCLLIRGNVPPGRVIISTRHIEILGGVEGSAVLAGGSLFVGGNVVGCGGLGLQAGGGLRVGAAKASSLRAGENAVIASAEECRVIAGRAVECKGIVLGGRIVAGGNVSVSGAGGTGAAAAIFAGAPEWIRNRYNQTYAELVSAMNRVKLLEEKMLPAKTAADPKDAPPIGSDGRRILELRLYQAKELARVSAAELKRLIKLMEKPSSECRVAIEGDARPGVCVTVGAKMFKVEKQMDAVYFELDPAGKEIRAAKIETRS